MRDPIERLFGTIKKLDRTETTHSLALFRILFFGHMLCLIADIFIHRPIVFFQSNAPLIKLFPASLFLMLWFIAALFMLFGWATRYFSVINYTLVVIACTVFRLAQIATFYNDLLLMGSLFAVFLPVSRSFSIDRSINQYKNPTAHENTSYLNYLLFLLVTLGLMYFASSFTKLNSNMWQKGLGLWIPLSIPFNKWNHLPDYIIDQYWLMASLNYFVIFWEFIFIFCLFFRKTHVYIAIAGIGFHLTIALFMPFSLISLGPIAFYALFIPSTFWHSLLGKLKLSLTLFQLPVLNKIYPLVLSKQTSPSTATIKYSFKQNLLIAFAVFISVVQLIIIVVRLYKDINKVPMPQVFEQMRTNTKADPFSFKPVNIMRTFISVNARGVFTDKHFQGMYKSYAITYTDKSGNVIWLPINDQRGRAQHELNRLISWQRVSYNLISTKTGPVNAAAVEMLTSYWAQKHHVPLDSIRFNLLSRIYVFPVAFEKGYWQKLESLPWHTEGYINWYQGKCTYSNVLDERIK